MITGIVHIKNRVITNPRAVRKMFELKDGAYRFEGKRINKRSTPKNSYYWAICVALVREGLKDLGHDVSAEETHDWLKSKFNYKEIINESTGEVERIPRSTTELSKTEFAEYISKVQIFAAEFLGVIIPDPNSQMTLNY